MIAAVFGVALMATGDPRPPPGPALPILARPATPPAGPQSRGSAPLDAADRQRRDAVVDELRAADAQATEHPETAEPALRDALRAFADIAPLVAEDAQAQSARTYAQLALARTLLVLDQPDAAAKAMDAALRTARGETLPAATFGPSLVALHDQRAARLAEREPATLQVRCRTPCRVLVDEHPFEPGPLPAGRHRVWIESEAAGLPVLRREIEPAPGEVVQLRYSVAAPEPEPISAPLPAVPPPPPPPRRLLPRWATVLGLGTGTAVAGIGGALVAADHRCRDLSDPRRVPCLRILNTDAGGWTLVGLGSAVAIGSAVVLVVDEVRHRRARRARR